MTGYMNRNPPQLAIFPILGFATRQTLEENTSLSWQTFGIGQVIIGLDPQAKWNLLLTEILQPFLADKLPIGGQIGNFLGTKGPQKAIDQTFSFLGVRVSCFGQHRPEEGDGHTLVDNSQNQKIN